jgi:hypothetical protein
VTSLISELAWMRYSSRSEAHGAVFTSEQEANLRRAIANYHAL